MLSTCHLGGGTEVEPSRRVHAAAIEQYEGIAWQLLTYRCGKLSLNGSGASSASSIASVTQGRHALSRLCSRDDRNHELHISPPFVSIRAACMAAVFLVNQHTKASQHQSSSQRPSPCEI
jgi:hypothetical protein